MIKKGLLLALIAALGAWVIITSKTPDGYAVFDKQKVEDVAQAHVKQFEQRFLPTRNTKPRDYDPAITLAEDDQRQTVRAWSGWRLRSALTYTPAAHPTDKKLPLVVLFHGANRTGLSMIDMWKRTADEHGIALLALNSAGPTWDRQNLNTSFLRKTIAQRLQAGDIQEDRIFLFGHSDGGVYAQILLNRVDGPWRAAATHGAYARPEHLSPVKGAKPLRLYLGSRDSVFKQERGEQAAKMLAKAGHAVDLVTIPNHGHWFYAAGENISEHAWEWLLRQVEAKD